MNDTGPAAARRIEKDTIDIATDWMRWSPDRVEVLTCRSRLLVGSPAP